MLLTGAAFDPRQRDGDQAWRHLAEERRVLVEGQKVAKDGWILVIRVGTKLLCYSVINNVGTPEVDSALSTWGRRQRKAGPCPWLAYGLLGGKMGWSLCVGGMERKRNKKDTLSVI